MLTALLICFLAAVDGVQLYQQREFAAAESELRRALATRPGDARIRLYLARTLVELGRIPEAISEIERALRTQADPEIQFQAGQIIRELAQRRFADLERRASDSAAVRELKGRQFEREGKLQQALGEYRAAMTKQPDRLGLHFEAGNILWRMRELDAAAGELERELAWTPHHGMANLRLGQVFLARDQPAQALPYLEQAGREMPDSPEARRELGIAYRNLGRLGEARKQWEAEAQARPDDDQVHYLLGNLYRQLGEADLARRELNRHREILERRRKRD